MTDDVRGILTFLALCLLLIGIGFVSACAPSEALQTYRTDVRPEVTAELDTVTDAGLNKLCDMNISRTARQIEKRGKRWGMGMGLMCQQEWEAIGSALKSAETVRDPVQNAD